MGIAAAAALAVGTFGVALAAVSAVRRRPLVLAAPLALAVLVCFEALLLDLLSLVHAVGAPGVSAAHAAIVGAGVVVAWRRGAGPVLADLARRARGSARALGLPALLAVPAGALCAVSALRYLPNNWDSMTYHLARVAHWLEQRSVAPYPTHVVRQLVLQPGAEYVLAAVQAMGRSDRLANLLQLGAWVVAVVSSPPLARLAGAPRRIAPWAAVVVAAIPMGLVQASSTQNDLVAAALTVAVIAATLPFLHRTPRWRAADAALLGVALGAAALVKATALVAAAPFLAFAVVRAVLAVPRRPGRIAVAATLAVLCAAVPVAPEAARRERPDLAAALAGIGRSYVYPGLAELPDRLQNLVRGVVRHVPAPRAVVAAVGIDRWCAPGPGLCEGTIFRAHEDVGGNPLHVALALLAAAVAAVRLRRLPARTPAFLGSVLAAWVLFHLVFRDNEWISRLETPTFVLAGLGVAAWGARPGGSSGGAAPGRGATLRAWLALAATALAATVAIHFGTRVACENEIRPPLGARAAVALGYYTRLPDVGREHDAVLAEAARRGCDRLGLAIGGDSYDYPLTWRAMQRGIEVRHVFGADPWPCLVFSDQHPSPELARSAGWTATSLPFVYLNGGPGAAPPARSGG